MACIRTGADVLLIEYGNKVVHGDLFKVGGTYILHCVQGVENCATYVNGPFVNVNIVAYSFEECGSSTIAFTDERAGEFFYHREAFPVRRD